MTNSEFRMKSGSGMGARGASVYGGRGARPDSAGLTLWGLHARMKWGPFALCFHCR